jgi:hypothetical protein
LTHELVVPHNLEKEEAPEKEQKACGKEKKRVPYS